MLEQLGKRFLATLEGKMIGGAVAAGAVTAIVAVDENLPVQAPAIPLDKLAPGLAVQISYEGPARHPTQAMLTFSYTPAAASPAAPKPPMTDAERFRAESARLARAQQQFRESLKSPPQRRSEEEERWQRFVQRHDPFNLFDLERIGVHLPAKSGASRPGQGRLMRKAIRPVSRLAPVVGGAPPLHRAARAEPVGGAARGLPLAPSGRQQAIPGDQVAHFEQLLNRGRGLLKRELGPIEGGFWFMNGVELQFYVSDPALFQHYDFHPVQWAGPEVIWVSYGDPATPTWQEHLRSEGAGLDGPEPQNVAISRKQGIIAYYDSPGPDISKHLDKRPSRIHVVQNFTGWVVGRLRAGGAAPLSRGRLAQRGQLGGSQLARQSANAKMGAAARRRQSIGHGLGGYVKAAEDLNMALCYRDLRRRYVE